MDGDGVTSNFSRILHPNKGYLCKPIDFVELWIGASEKLTGAGRKSWNGGFEGRRDLADLVWPALQTLARDWGQSSLVQAAAALRSFWRFLDSYEAVFEGEITRDVLGGALGQLWLYPPPGVRGGTPRPGYYSLVAQILKMALGPTQFHWPNAPRSISNDKDIPAEEEARAAFHLLAEQAKKIFRRWKRADELAQQGRNLLDIPRKQQGKDGRMLHFYVTESDIHATYRAIIQRLGDPLPRSTQICALFGLVEKKGVPPWWHRTGLNLDDAQYGLYPSPSDLYCLSQLFMARTGWNPSTVYSIDISNPLWARIHGRPDNDIWVIESWKERSKGWQTTLCRGRVQTGPLHIVQALIDRTKPLRDLLATGAHRLSTDASVDVDAARLSSFVKTSPWLAAGNNRFSGRVVSINRSQPNEASSWFRQKVVAHNAQAEERNVEIDKDNAAAAIKNALLAKTNATLPIGQLKPLVTIRRRAIAIPLTFVPSDWRDVFATHVFQESRYSMVMVQWALGQRHLTSTRHYLRNRLWRQFSEKRLQQAQEVLFEELGAGRCDPTILHARLELGIVPNEEQLSRLERFRMKATPAGYVCSTPYTPPREIDPNNPLDGKTPCRAGTRCPGCPRGYAFDARRMVLRLVELEKIRASVSVVIWSESQLSADLDQLRIDLEQWSADEVAEYRVFWEEEIRNARYHLDPWSSFN
ncbi:hypothetical protein R2APBS1_3890 [Rhodanobacter denitrificans]|uniref:Integrase n=2 Tax=Rhodanobacteraceae TaxID=1775411 RepID=M4NU10_9GAMM|nr:hypothetical protein R2APBS1_3890 [Rhodanobacter denitrificans]